MTHLKMTNYIYSVLVVIDITVIIFIIIGSIRLEFRFCTLCYDAYWPECIRICP